MVILPPLIVPFSVFAAARAAHFLFSAFWGSLVYYAIGRTCSGSRMSILYSLMRWDFSLSASLWAHYFADLILRLP